MRKRLVSLCLMLMITIIVFNISSKFWAEDSENQKVIIYTLSPYPRNKMLDFEHSLCSSPYTSRQPPSHHNIQCPQKPIVTVTETGRLGNQMYEYILVWAVAKKTGREPYVPSCLIQELEKIFQNITVPPLSYLAYCTVDNYPVSVTMDKLDRFNGSILLPKWAWLPKYIVPLLHDIRQIFQFKDDIVETSHRLLYSVSKGVKNITYVGVHVRRTDYKRHLKWRYLASMVKPDYFLKQMNVFRNKYKPVMFVVLSDDPEWCERELPGGDIVVVRTNSAAQDLAIMAACNHSIIDYGTYGMWGAILAGGDTMVYNLKPLHDAAYEMALLLPNWHIVK